jgi:hypothetical protein
MVGVDPCPFTMRELAWMAEARNRVAWEHTASVLAMLFNINRDPKRARERTARDFNPYYRRRQTKGIPLTADTLHMLKTVFVDRKGGV